VITWEDVVKLDPNLSTVPVQVQGQILGVTSRLISPDPFGTRFDDACMFFAAHLGALHLRGGGLGASGIVVSESLGDASRSYSPPPTGSGDDHLGLTVWGQHFRLLMKSFIKVLVP
jgi:hypothetical protein